MRKVYVVEGSTGEYSDHREWMVAAYLSEASAAKRVQECQLFANEVFPKRDLEWEDRDAWESLIKSGPDPKMQFDYTGTRYNFYPVDLVDNAEIERLQGELTTARADGYRAGIEAAAKATWQAAIDKSRDAETTEKYGRGGVFAIMAFGDQAASAIRALAHAKEEP